MIYNYERLLRQVTYTNKKPAYYLNRQFKIVCSEMNGRFVSNEYSQMVIRYFLNNCKTLSKQIKCSTELKYHHLNNCILMSSEKHERILL